MASTFSTLAEAHFPPPNRLRITSRETGGKSEIYSVCLIRLSLSISLSFFFELFFFKFWRASRQSLPAVANSTLLSGCRQKSNGIKWKLNKIKWKLTYYHSKLRIPFVCEPSARESLWARLRRFRTIFANKLHWVVNSKVLQKNLIKRTSSLLIHQCLLMLRTETDLMMKSARLVRPRTHTKN